MAERIPREQSLKRVHGPSALFAAAYGNVGSSIYYALGVVALYALGLTPVTFMIAGLIFVFTAATYTEATVMYPEAGGSSSFARHAFNELVSFFAAWGQMLTYIITIAISAFFVPHYLAVFWDPLGHGPGDVIGGVILIGLLALLNIKGTQESARLNLVLAVADLFTQVLLVFIGIFLVLDPDLLVNQVSLGTAPTWGDFALGIAVGMVAYTGIETISNMAEEAKKPFGKTIPQGVGMVVLAVVGLYALLPAIALSAMPVTFHGGEYTTELGTVFADDPVLGIVENIGLADGLTDVLQDLRRRTGGGDPGDRDQRRADRRLAAHILDGAPPAAARAPAADSSEVPHPAHRDPRVLGGRDDHRAAGQDRLPGDDVLVRRDALLHDRARLRDQAAAALPGRRARLEAAGQLQHARGRGSADRRARRARHPRGLDRGDGARPDHPGGRRRMDGARHGDLPRSTVAPTASRSPRPSRSCCRSRSASRRSSTSRS